MSKKGALFFIDKNDYDIKSRMNTALDKRSINFLCK